MAASRFYSSTAGQMFLSGSITNSAVSATLTVTTGLPASLPYTLLLDPGLATEEVVEVTGIGGAVVTITRGMDGSSGQAHANGAEVRHGFSARDFQDSRNHEANTTTAHGATGFVVGTTNTQTLTNKSISGGTNTLSAIPIGAVTNGVDLASAQTLTNKVIAGASNTLTSVGGNAVVGTADTQTLTNKVIDGKLNTLTNTTPTGTILMFAASGFPTGYLLCDGSAVSRTGASAALFAVCGTTYGVGDGSTTFNVPNLTNMFPYGGTLGATGGEATHVLTNAELPAHAHGPAAGTNFMYAGGSGSWQKFNAGSGVNADIQPTTANSTGGGGAHNNMPPYLGVNFIIKL